MAVRSPLPTCVFLGLNSSVPAVLRARSITEFFKVTYQYSHNILPGLMTSSYSLFL